MYTKYYIHIYIYLMVSHLQAKCGRKKIRLPLAAL